MSIFARALKEKLKALMSLERPPVFILGAPGVGKSMIVAEVAKELGMAIIDLRALLLDPTDIRGIPAIKGDTAIWLKPVFLPDEKRDGEKGILFLDELNAAPPLVQASCYQLILNRRVGEYIMPKGWRIIAAGNRHSDLAITNRMPTPLVNRFHFYTLEVSFEDWKHWAYDSGVNQMVISFLNFKPELLFVAPKDRDTPFPTPRCLHPDSMVLMGNGDFKRIEDVNIGDTVISVTPTGVRPSKVLRHFKQNISDMVLVNDALLCSSEHRIMTPGGFVQAQYLNTSFPVYVHREWYNDVVKERSTQAKEALEGISPINADIKDEEVQSISVYQNAQAWYKGYRPRAQRPILGLEPCEGREISFDNEEGGLDISRGTDRWGGFVHNNESQTHSQAAQPGISGADDNSIKLLRDIQKMVREPGIQSEYVQDFNRQQSLYGQGSAEVHSWTKRISAGALCAGAFNTVPVLEEAARNSVKAIHNYSDGYSIQGVSGQQAAHKAYAHAYSPELEAKTAFIRRRTAHSPQVFHDIMTERGNYIANGVVVHNSWEHVSNIIGAIKEPDEEDIAGSVGPGPAREFHVFMRIYKDLPSSAEDILSRDVTFKALDKQFALNGMLIQYFKEKRKLDKDVADAVIRYSYNVPKEAALCLVRDCLIIDGPAIGKAKEFPKWSKEFSGTLNRK